MDSLNESRKRNALLIAAAIIAAPKLLELKDTPALRATVADAIRVAEYMAKVLETREVGAAQGTGRVRRAC